MEMGNLAHTEKILVVDDEEELRALLCYELKRSGFLPIPCSGLKHAVQNYLEHLPKVVLSDMRMPDGTGLELYLQLKDLQTSLKSNFSFLVMTGYCKESPEVLKSHGISEVLFKPFPAGAIVQAVKSALNVATC